MSGLTIPCEYRYLHESRLDRGQLLLATSASLMPSSAASAGTTTSSSASRNASQADGTSPHFFSGTLVKPRRTSGLLRGLMNIVRSRFHVPAAMLNRILAESDPVVTCSDGRIRFEGFSACCGAYARVDLLPEAVDGQTLCRGTTNVDFNQPMLTALAKIRDNDHVTLSVGADHVQLSRNAEAVIEKQVALPVRWLKGFVEVQSCQSRMTLIHDVSGREAMRFLRSLPRMKTNRRETFVAAAGGGLRLSQLPAPNVVRVGGLERLRVLESIVPDAERLRIYADDVTGASAWELSYSDCRFHLVISPEVWRGFSGEGQALNAMAAGHWDTVLPMVRSCLAWDAVIDEEALHRRVSLLATPNFSADALAIRGALSALGTQGIAGFDLAEGCWFHRELPFDLNAVEKHHPRLKDAQKLLAEGHVRVGRESKEQVEVLVQSGGVDHRVRLSSDDARCTCPWFARYGSSRGPCKHILASQMFLENAEDGFESK